MDFEITLPPAAEAVSPLMITSPTSHGGTAMLQRAICRSDNGICYGDNLFEELLSIIEWATTLIEAHQDRRDAEQAALEKALARSPDKWMPDAAPHFDTHMSSIFSTIYNIPHTAQETAREHGREVWGMIRCDVPAPLMTDLLSVFPSGKAILIHRNPFDIARDLLRDDPGADIHALAQTWSLGMEAYLRAANERLVKLRYEDAAADPAAFAEAMTSAIGIRGLPVESFRDGDESELSTDRKLSDSERAVIAGACENMLAVFYPEMA